MILEKLRNAFFSSATGLEWFHRKRGRSQNPFVKCCQFSIFESSLALAELIQEVLLLFQTLVKKWDVARLKIFIAPKNFCGFRPAHEITRLKLSNLF